MQRTMGVAADTDGSLLAAAGTEGIG